MNVEVEVPEWANWMAMDESGRWWFYKDCPEQCDHIWHTFNDDYYWASAYRDPDPESKDWTQELYQVVWEWDMLTTFNLPSTGFAGGGV